MTNIILCGGNGTRLWPISRENNPKQFLKLFNGQSLFQKTILRNTKYSDNVIVISNAKQYFLAKDHIEELNIESDFIIETIGRDTAAAIAFGAFHVDKDEILFVTPSDALIKDDQNYQKIIKNAQDVAKNGYIVTFGIVPAKPETGYGYIETQISDNLITDVLNFKEKPDLTTAQKYLALNISSSNRQYLWNSGMFMFRADIFIKELQKYAPDIYKNAYKAYENTKMEGTFKRLDANDLLHIPKISIDHAIMEKSDKLKVVRSNIEWSDIGSFDSLNEVFEKDENNNTKRDNLTVYEAKNNFVFGKYKEIALCNVENLIVVDTPSALLIGKKGMSQNVKKMVGILSKKNPEIVKLGRSVCRPWGKFVNLIEKDGFRVKRIVVNPGKRLSLQKHYHRSEHWTVVKGTGQIQINDKEFILRPNESTYIPIGSVHRLTNIGKISLEIIEVQVGEYLEEDDIVRFKDDYFRVQ